MWLAKKYYYITVWEWIVLILAIIILMTYTHCQVASPDLEKYTTTNKNLTWISLKDVLQDAKNGDLVLLSGNTSGEKTCKWCTQTIFSHVGFLFREIHPTTKEDIVYIFDCDLGQETKDGVRIMPLRDKLYKYKGIRIGAFKKLIVRDGRERPSHKKIMELVKKYSPIEFDNRIATWWVANWKRIHTLVKNPNTMFCSELVATILQDMNILKRDRVGSWYHPGDFHNNRLNLEEGYSYGESRYYNFAHPS